jgi:hypothetical protein
MNGVKIDVRYDPSPEEKALIVNGLVAFNESKVEMQGSRNLGYSLPANLNRLLLGF